MSEVRISAMSIPAYAGIRLMGDPHMVDVVEDWSEVRSPSRAARRRRRGHPQRIRCREVPKPRFIHIPAKNMIVAHPVMIDRLHARLAEDMNRRRVEQTLNALLGRRVV